jgi:hypothetical protein
MFFGAACLVRPIYLVSPALIFALLKFIRALDLRRSTVLTLIFAAGLLGTLLPYSIRSSIVSGRLLLISDQGSWVLWANSVTPFYSLGRLENWRSDIWLPFGRAVFSQVTGQPSYSTAALYQFSNQLSEAYGRNFLQELTSRPGVYAGNVASNFLQYFIQPEAFFERLFWQALPASTVQQAGALRGSFSAFFQATTLPVFLLLSFLALRNSVSARLTLILLLFLAGSYCFTFLDERYLYGRIPIVLLALAMIPSELSALFENRPTWPAALSSLVMSTITAVVLAAPVIFLLRAA